MSSREIGRIGDGHELARPAVHAGLPVADRPPAKRIIGIGQQRLQHRSQEPPVLALHHLLDGVGQRFLDFVLVGRCQLLIHADGHALLFQRRQIVGDLVQTEEHGLVDQMPCQTASA